MFTKIIQSDVQSILIAHMCIGNQLQVSKYMNILQST